MKRSIFRLLVAVRDKFFRGYKKSEDWKEIKWLIYGVPGMLHPGNLFLFDYVINNLPSSDPIFEIGSFAGLSANIISYYLRKYGKNNKILTCDVWDFRWNNFDHSVFSKLGLGIDESRYSRFIQNSFIRNSRFFSKGGLPYAFKMSSDNFFLNWSKKAVKKDIFGRKYKMGGNISFAYIDGNHSYNNVKKDFENVDHFLARGGYILFDDSADFSGHECSHFMREMLLNKNYELVYKNPNYLFKKRIE